MCQIGCILTVGILTVGILTYIRLKHTQFRWLDNAIKKIKCRRNTGSLVLIALVLTPDQEHPKNLHDVISDFFQLHSICRYSWVLRQLPYWTRTSRNTLDPFPFTFFLVIKHSQPIFNVYTLFPLLVWEILNKLFTHFVLFSDIQEFYEVTLLDENKSTQQKTLETLQMASKWEVQQPNSKNDVS
jgi:hypothetical protein